LFYLIFNDADFAEKTWGIRQELFSEPEDVHDDSLRNVVCVVPRHNLAHTQLTGQIDSGTFLNYVTLFKTKQKSRRISSGSKAIIYSSVVNPDSRDLQGSAFIWLSWIRIPNHIRNADPDPGAWKSTTIYK
jgi:hypothetical protein